jgi:cytochrome d ubiquinol oxidase subunit II
MGVIAGVLAVVGLIVLRSDDRALFDDLTSGAGLVAVIVSALAGVATIALVQAGRYEPARYSGALAVAAIIAGWGLAQRPDLLPGLTVHEAAGSHATLVALIISIAVGLAILVPSLVLLYSLVLRGRFDEGVEPVAEHTAPRAAPRPRLAGLAIALLVVGSAMTFLGEGAVLAVGVIALGGFIVTGVVELLRPEALD